jgi:hypothetical protein
MPCRLKSRVRSGLCAALTIFALAAPALANGLDTPPGVGNLPFNIEGSPVMNMESNGLGIMIGTAAPQAALDINGGVRATGTALDAGVQEAIKAGNPCSPEGMLGYDMTNHEPVYCSQNTGSGSVWTSSVPPQFTAMQVLLWSNCSQSEFTVNLSPSNLSAYGIPSTATSIELAMYLEDGPGHAYYVNGYMDPTTVPSGEPPSDATDFDGKVCFGTANMSGLGEGVGCAGTFLASPASHIFYQDAGGDDACALYIKGYYN